MKTSKFKIEAESADGVRVSLVLEAPREHRVMLWKLMCGATACFDEVLGRHRIVAVESCDQDQVGEFPRHARVAWSRG